MNSELNYEHVFEVLVDRTSKYLLEHNLKAMVLGISGGIDSTVVAAICYEVSKRTGILLIGRSLPIKNKYDESSTARLVGKAFCNDFCECNLYNLYNEISNSFKGFEHDHYLKELEQPNSNYGVTSISEGNIQARLRMIYLYNLASIHNGIVLSTDNQTEYQLGFWTLHGDVGDFNPLNGLWKTEVYELARWIERGYTLEYQASVIDKNPNKAILDKAKAIQSSINLTPTDGLGISNSDLEQIGAKSYNEVDHILQDLLNPDYNFYTALSDLRREYGVDVVNKVWDRHMASEFKRKNLPITIDRHEYD